MGRTRPAGAEPNGGELHRLPHAKAAVLAVLAVRGGLAQRLARVRSSPASSHRSLVRARRDRRAAIAITSILTPDLIFEDD